MLRSKMTKRPLSVLAGLVAAACLALAGCAASGPGASSSGSPASSSAGSRAAEQNADLDLGTSMDSKPAPDFTLTSQFGEKMSLSQFRGRVTLLSFEDPECTDVCPLTTQSMVIAKELLGKAGKSVQLLGVDANPTATGVPDVLAYSRAHGLTNQWDFLTGSAAQLKKVWTAYDIAVQIQDGDIDHTPALYVINAQGKLMKVYLTQMAYDSVTQSGQVIASEVASLLPGHPKLSSLESLATIATQGPQDKAALPAVTAAGPGADTVSLGPGKPRLVVFFATWLTEVSDLKSELTSLNTYAEDAPGKKLPPVTAVDETVTEPSGVSSVTSYLKTLPALSYPVGLDETGRVADGYGVQDQPWLTLVSAAGKITWQHDGWVPLSTLEKAAAAHP